MQPPTVATMHIFKWVLDDVVLDSDVIQLSVHMAPGMAELFETEFETEIYALYSLCLSPCGLESHHASPVGLQAEGHRQLICAYAIDACNFFEFRNDEPTV